VNLFVFGELKAQGWMEALLRLERAREARNRAAAEEAYADLYAALAALGARDLLEAGAQGFLWSDAPLAHLAMGTVELPQALLVGAAHDLETLLPLLRRDYARHVAEMIGREVPPIRHLAAPAGGTVSALAKALEEAFPGEILRFLLERYRTDGGGTLARDRAFRWSGGALHGIAHPAEPDFGHLVGLEDALARLEGNTEVFLSGGRAQHALLYGPRGSGKSTAVKGLGPRYAARGLRLVEVSPADLTALPSILELLRGRPHRYLLFVDDLAFGADDRGYAPLKTLLEGSLTARPANVLVYATSNRRHLVTERFSDRPDPLEGEVHAWDAQHERLALADRFGLVLTFPNATQRRYLEIVQALARREGVGPPDLPDLNERAIRYAEWGNGYSGRTAQQFVEALSAGLA